MMLMAMQIPEAGSQSVLSTYIHFVLDPFPAPSHVRCPGWQVITHGIGLKRIQEG
jgi:hypothetical protein